MKNISKAQAKELLVEDLSLETRKDEKGNSHCLVRVGLRPSKLDKNLEKHSCKAVYLIFPGRLIDCGFIESLTSLQGRRKLTDLISLIKEFEREIKFIFLNEPEINSPEQRSLNLSNAIEKLKNQEKERKL